MTTIFFRKTKLLRFILENYVVIKRVKSYPELLQILKNTALQPINTTGSSPMLVYHAPLLRCTALCTNNL